MEEFCNLRKFYNRNTFRTPYLTNYTIYSPDNCSLLYLFFMLIKSMHLTPTRAEGTKSYWEVLQPLRWSIHTRDGKKKPFSHLEKIPQTMTTNCNPQQTVLNTSIWRPPFPTLVPLSAMTKPSAEAPPWRAVLATPSTGTCPGERAAREIAEWCFMTYPRSPMPPKKES